MTEKLVEVTAYVEDKNEVITLKVLPETAKRAAKDTTFLIGLVNDEYERRSRELCQQLYNSDCNSQSSSKDSTSDTINLPPSPESRGSDCKAKDENENEKSLFIWPSQLVFLLLDIYEKRKEEFTSGIKRHHKIWNSIAADMQEVNPKCTITGQQCQTKLNGLKKTYKKILDHNSVSGNDRKMWTYFERMHEVFQKSGWANPKAIASEAGPSILQVPLSSKSENVKEHKKRKVDTFDDILEKMKDKQIKRKEEKKENSIKFEVLVQQRQKQHEEKMTMMQQLLDAISKNKN